MKLGCCYYPEHWPEHMWADDARQMAAMGISLVRIGEFAWSRIEPEPGRYDWGWLDRAIETLAAAGLKVILGTPTATPPKWLVDTMPDLIAIDAQGHPRGFGSRRHYCFSHAGYRAQAQRIVTALAVRYGQHPAIVMWQTDNEYGCHDTVLSFSEAAGAAFRSWLEARYGSIAALNAAWGNVFWSMEYRAFAEVDPPHLTVTEANPAHWLDYRRFASDQVVSFNAAQVDILRAHSPGKDITHNFMGFFTEFDHHALGRDIDVATWDSYPLGFLEQFWFTEPEKRAYLRQGHPDIAAFHHDLYRGCCAADFKGRWGVMEQQPGPVNWARFNPAPLPGMVSLWTLEAAAHGAEFTAYFRWRQAPFAQEQLHAGLLRPDSSEAEAADEVRNAARVLAQIGPQTTTQAAAALVFSYEAAWVIGIQPHGANFRYLELVFAWYSALRSCGLDVDIVAPDADLAGYRMVMVPTLPIIPAGFAERIAALTCPVMFGPRTGSKTASFAIPDGLPPGDLKAIINLAVTRVESLRNAVEEPADGWGVTRWREDVRSPIPPEFSDGAGRGVVYAAKHVRYCAIWPDAALLRRLIGRLADEAQVALIDLPEGVRLRRSASHSFTFNYASEPVFVPHLGQKIAPAGWHIAPL